MRQGPSDDAKSLGRLPKGSIVTLTDDVESHFFFVTVDTEEGEIEGWVDQESLEKIRGKSDTPSTKVRKKRMVIPKDEALLLKRESSFFYGIQGGVNLGFIQVDLTGATASGIGFHGGASAGVYFSPNFPVSLEINYTQLAGTADALDIGFGFLDVAVVPHYILDRLPLEIYAGFEYSFGLSLKNIPRAIALTGPSDVSNLAVLGGIGYRIPLGYFSDFVVRGRFSTSFLRSPFAFNVFSILFAVEFKG